MLKFDNYPPQEPSDVKLSPAGELEIEGIAEGEEGDLYVFAYHAGKVVTASLANPTLEFVSAVSDHLTREWGDDEELFKKGMTDGFEAEMSAREVVEV